MLSTFSYFSTACINTGRVCCLFYCYLQSLYKLSTFCAWTVSLKRTPPPCQFSWWSLTFHKTRLNSDELECLTCQKSDIRTNSPGCMFYFGQVFVSCRLIKKNVLEYNVLWTDLRTFLVETIPNCVFDEEEVAEQLLCDTQKSSHQRFSIKTLFLEFLQYSRETPACNYEEHLFWRTCAYGCFWTGFIKWLFETLFMDRI